MRETQEERDKLEIEINNHKALSVNIESNKEGLQRMCSQLEADKQYMSQQINDLKIETSALRQQLEIERTKYQDLEIMIQNERRAVHDSQFMSGDLQRQNEELLADNERQKLRVQSLQTHIETLQRYGGNSQVASPPAQGGSPQNSNDLLRAQETIEELRRENERSQLYIQQYENQIRDLEQEIGKVNDE